MAEKQKTLLTEEQITTISEALSNAAPDLLDLASVDTQFVVTQLNTENNGLEFLFAEVFTGEQSNTIYSEAKNIAQGLHPVSGKEMEYLDIAGQTYFVEKKDMPMIDGIAADDIIQEFYVDILNGDYFDKALHSSEQFNTARETFYNTYQDTLKASDDEAAAYETAYDATMNIFLNIPKVNVKAIIEEHKNIELGLNAQTGEELPSFEAEVMTEGPVILTYDNTANTNSTLPKLTEIGDFSRSVRVPTMPQPHTSYSPISVDTNPFEAPKTAEVTKVGSLGSIFAKPAQASTIPDGHPFLEESITPATDTTLDGNTETVTSEEPVAKTTKTPVPSEIQPSPTSIEKPFAEATQPFVRAPEPTIYKIKSGDTLTSIVNKHYNNPENLKEVIARVAEFNDIDDPNLIRAGQRLKLPGKDATIAANNISAPTADSRIVERGDRLSDMVGEHYGIQDRDERYRIALKIGELNKIDPNKLAIGQEINFPHKIENYTAKADMQTAEAKSGAYVVTDKIAASPMTLG